VKLLLNRELVSRVNLCLVSVFPAIVRLPEDENREIFLSFPKKYVASDLIMC